MSDQRTPRLSIEVAYAERERQFLEALEVEPGTTAAGALALSALGREFPKLDLGSAALGVWGRSVSRDHPLADGDRVEVYRPLAMDPREARRRLAGHGGAMGRKSSPGDDSGR